MLNSMILSWCWAAAALLALPQDSVPGIEHGAQRGKLGDAWFTAKREGALRVLTGGAIAGSGSRSAAFLSELYEAARLDAISVGYDDLASEAPGVRDLLASPKLPFVCANVKGAGRTHVIRPMGATRVAFVGVTRPPAYVKAPSLKDWTIEDPAAALRRLIPELAKEADVIVLLAVMDRIECADLLRTVTGIHVALVPAGVVSDPDPIAVGTASLVQSSGDATTFSRLTLKAEGGKVSAVANRVETAALSAADREKGKALYARHKEGIDLDRLVTGVVPAPPAVPVKETGPLTSLESGKAQAVVVLRSDAELEIRIDSVQVTDAVGERKAPPRSAWLVVQSQWKNLIPEVTAAGRQLATVYSVADASNNVYAVVNGKTLSRLDGELSAGPGGLLVGRSIALPRQGSVRKGVLVFPIPSTGVETLELQYYDFRHPASVFPLVTRPGAVPGAEEKPMLPSVKNEILEVGVFRMTRGKDGQNPAEGPGFVLIDLRARSLATTGGEKDRIGVAGDIQDAWKGLRLVSGGGVESEPEVASLPAAPRFLPSAMTGWELLFRVPATATDLELRWSFPDIGLPDGRILKPAVLRIPLAGKGAVPARVCRKCGEAAGSVDKFCSKCGTKIDDK